MRSILAVWILLVTTQVAAAEIHAGAQHVLLMTAGDTGELDVEPGRGFAAFVDVFWSPRVSTRFAGTFVNPAAILFPSTPPPADVDLGTLGLDLYSATARWHCGAGSRFSAFVGAGGALVVIGNLDDRFGEDVEIEFDPELTLVAEGGVRYRIHPRITLEAGVAYLPLEVTSEILRSTDARITLPAAIALDPLIVSAGASWRF